MDFKVITGDDGSGDTFSGDDRYLLDDGRLVIWTSDKKITMGEGSWKRIEEPYDPNGNLMGTVW